MKKYIVSLSVGCALLVISLFTLDLIHFSEQPYQSLAEMTIIKDRYIILHGHYSQRSDMERLVHTLRIIEQVYIIEQIIDIPNGVLGTTTGFVIIVKKN
jgi:hypothetical protein